MKKTFLLFILALSLTACTTQTKFIEVETIQFVGDQAPMVSSQDAFLGEYGNLAPNESLVVAKAKDGSGALSQPATATIKVIEPELEGDSNSGFDLWLKRCDFDGDGALDRHCPELFESKNSRDELSNSKFVSIKSWYAINSNPKIDKDFWGDIQTINTADSESKKIPVTLKLLAINLGNKAFDGDMDVVVNVPGRVEVGSIKLASKVTSRAGAKVAVDIGIQVLGALAGVPIYSSFGDTVFDDYAPVKSNAKFDITGSSKDRVLVKVSDIQLEPNQGATLEFDALYEIVD